MRLNVNLAVAMALFAAVPAQAQLASGYSGFSGVRSASMEEYYWSLAQLGSCLASSKPKPSWAFLASAPGSAAEGAAVKALLGKGTVCLRSLSRMSVNRHLLRGSISEALYKRSVSAPLAPGTNSASAPAEMNIKDLKVLGYDRLIAGLASCFATRRPELIHQLLTSSQPGSEREQEMVTSMAASFAPCLPRNIKLNVPSAELRLAFAEAAYLRLPAPVPGR
jgi:hypothetical protein